MEIVFKIFLVNGRKLANSECCNNKVTSTTLAEEIRFKRGTRMQGGAVTLLGTGS